jgi:hypothetical protein
MKFPHVLRIVSESQISTISICGVHMAACLCFATLHNEMNILSRRLLIWI